MPFEDFSTYTEVDPNSHITKTADRITYTGLTRNEAAYVYDDKGAAHFDGDLDHLLAVNYDGLVDTGVAIPWMLTNTVATRQAIIDASGDSLQIVTLAFLTGNAITHYVQEIVGGAIYTSAGYLNTTLNSFWLRVVRDENVGSFGSLTLYIYSNSPRTTLIGTLILTLHAKIDLRHIFGLNVSDDGNASGIDGHTEFLDLQEAVVGNPWYYYAQQ